MGISHTLSITDVKDTEIGKKLKHMPYNELGELVQEVKAENYEQIQKFNEQEKQKGATKERLSVWKNQQSATEKGESRSTKEEEICPFAFV